MKKKIFVILLLTTLVANFYTSASLEAIETKPEITNVKSNNFGI